MKLELRVENETNSVVRLPWLSSKYSLRPYETITVKAEDTLLFDGKKSKSKNARDMLNFQKETGQISLTVLTDCSVDTSGKTETDGNTVSTSAQSEQVESKGAEQDKDVVANMVSKNSTPKTPEGITAVKSETAEESQRMMTPEHSKISSDQEKTLDLTQRDLRQAEQKDLKSDQMVQEAVNAANEQPSKSSSESKEASTSSKFSGTKTSSKSNGTKSTSSKSSSTKSTGSKSSSTKSGESKSTGSKTTKSSSSKSDENTNQ